MALSQRKLESIFQGIHSGKISIESLPLELSQFTYDELMKFVSKGYGELDSDFKIRKMAAYDKNITAFSGAKTFQEVNDLNNFVFNADGSKRAFKEFREFAQAINEQYNVKWLKTEQDTAFGMSQSSQQWEEIESEKDLFPMLKYETVADGRVRPDHAAWDQVIRPVDDSFWDTRMPLNGFNCYDRETEIYTDSGWKLFKDLSKTEKVITINPETKDLEWQKPINYINYHYSGEMVSVEAANMSICVTPDHNMLIRKSWDAQKKRDVLVMKKASELASGDEVFRGSSWVGSDLEDIDINGVKIKFDVFVKFMAWYLADGSTTKRSENCYQIKISQNRGNLYDRLVNDIYAMPFDIYFGNDYIGINSVELGMYLHKFGKCNKKYIPSEIKNSSKESISKFLDIYAITDGYVQRVSGRLDLEKYYTTSIKLRDDLSELIIKTGYACSISKSSNKGEVIKHRNGTYTSNFDCYDIRKLNSVYFNLNRKRNISKVDYNDNVYCVEVPEYNTLLIKRRGKIYWCGNCRCTVTRLTEGVATSLRGVQKNDDKMFAVNPGKVDYIFDEKKHPYFKHTKIQTAAFERSLKWRE